MRGAISKLIQLGKYVQVFYIPCAIALWSQTKQSCYKIMFTLAIIDCVELCVNAIYFGVMLLEGGECCTHPVLNYIVGALGLGQCAFRRVRVSRGR